MFERLLEVPIFRASLYDLLGDSFGVFIAIAVVTDSLSSVFSIGIGTGIWWNTSDVLRDS